MNNAETKSGTRRVPSERNPRSVSGWARHDPILAFLLLAFGIAWTGWTTRSFLFADQPKDRADWSALSLFLFYFGAGPAIGGFAVTYLTEGASGTLRLLQRCIQWRVPVEWWLFVLCAPITVTTILVAIAAKTHGIDLGHLAPSQVHRLITSPAILLVFTVGPLCEEAGWRGFLLPHLMRRHSALGASLIVAFIWAFWHFPLSFIPSSSFTFFHTNSGTLIFLVMVSSYAVVYTTIMQNCAGSVLLVMIIHWTLNASSRVVKGMFPDVQASDWDRLQRITEPWNVGTWVLIACLLVAMFGGRTLKGRSNGAPNARNGASALE